MLKKTITYIDFNGEERKEDFYFNLTKSECLELEFSHNGGLSTMMQRIVNEQNSSEIIKIFKDLIQKSYGVKSDDGKRFMKNEEILKSFTESEAYSELFMDLASNAESATAFMNGIVPQGMAKGTAPQTHPALNK